MQHRKSGSQPPVAVVTSAGRSHSEDIALRQRRYLVTQSVRAACVILATLLPVDPIWKGLLVVGAVTLPWFGVVMANAGPTVSRKRRSSMVGRTQGLDATPPRQIEPGKVIDGEP